MYGLRLPPSVGVAQVEYQRLKKFSIMSLSLTLSIRKCKWGNFKRVYLRLYNPRPIESVVTCCFDICYQTDLSPGALISTFLCNYIQLSKRT